MFAIINLLFFIILQRLVAASHPSVFDCHNLPVTEEVHEVKIGKPFLKQVSSLFSTQGPSDLFLEHHGLIVAYYKGKDGLSFFKAYGSGTMVQDDVVLTASHVLYLGKDPKQQEFNQFFLKNYEQQAHNVHFFTRSGLRYEFSNYCLHPLYISNQQFYKFYDMAFLYRFSFSAIVPNPFSLKIYSPGDDLQGQLWIHGYTVKEEIDTQTISAVERQYCTNDYQVKFTDTFHQDDVAVLFHNIQTKKGMSGAALYTKSNQQCHITAIHTMGHEEEGVTGAMKQWWNGTQKSPMSCLFSERKKQLLDKWHACFVKQQIWNKLENTKIENITQWKPALLSIQTDIDREWQASFIKKFNEELHRQSSASGVGPESFFQFSTLSGIAQDLTNRYLPLFLPPASLIDPELTIREGLFPESTCRDITLEGINQLQDLHPNMPALVIALGLGSNSKTVHEEMFEYIANANFLYERIDYLQHPYESDHAYNEKISFDAQRIAELLVNNARLRSEHTEEMEQNLVIGTFASTFDISGITSPEAITPIIEESAFTQKVESSLVLET